MIRRVILIAALLGIPLGIWVASVYGTLEPTTFSEAVRMSSTSSEGEQAPKSLVPVTVIDVPSDANSMYSVVDDAGVTFNLQFTGTMPVPPIQAKQRLRFVGHVHGATQPYFHATQVYE